MHEIQLFLIYVRGIMVFHLPTLLQFPHLITLVFLTPPTISQ